MSELNIPSFLDRTINIFILDNDNSENISAYTSIKNVITNARIFFIKDKNIFESILQLNKPDLIIWNFETGIFSIDELLPFAKNQTLLVPIIVFISCKNEDQAIKLINAGISDYIFKEYPKKLSHIILKCLADRENIIKLYYAQTDLSQYEHQFEKFKDYEENFPGMTFQFILHPDGRNFYSYAGSSSKNIFNLEQQDIVRDSKLLYNIFEPADINQLQESFRLSSITLNPFKQEVRRVEKEKTIWYQFNAKPKKQENGDIIWNGIILDTTDLKSLKEELELEKKLKDEFLDAIKTGESKPFNFLDRKTLNNENGINDISSLTTAVFDQFLFRFFMDHSPDVIYFKDKESRFIKVNKSFTNRIKDFSQENILGKTDFDIYDYAHASEARADEIRIIETGIPLINKIEKEVLHSGKTVWVSTTKIPLTNSEGEIVGTFGMSRDITDQKLVEEALALEQRLMKELIDSIPDKIYVRDLEGKYLLSNKAHLNSLGIKNREEIIGKTDFDFYDYKAAEKYREDDLHVFRTGKPSYSSEEESNRVSDKIYWYIRTKVPLKNDNGEIFGLVAISHDITEIKTVQEKLQASESRLHHLITTTSGVLYTMRIINNNFIPTWIGENIKQFGYKPEEIKENGFWDKIIHPDDYEYYISNKNTLLNDKRAVLEYRICKKNGEYIWLRDETVVIFNYFGKPSEIFGSWLDITERMQSEEALLAVEAQLNKALKIAKLAYWEYDQLNDTFILNDQYYSIMNTTAEEEGGYIIPTQQLLDHFVYPEDRHILLDQIRKASETKESRYSGTIEYRFLFPNGGFGFLIVRYDFIKETAKAFGAIQDITERKKADEALSASEYFLRKSQLAARIGSYKFDISKGNWESSETLYDICGIDGNFPKDINSYINLIHHEHRDIITAEIKKDVNAHQNRLEKEFKIIRANDSKERWILMIGDIEFDKDYNPLAIIGTIQDITDRVNRDQEKHELENQLRQRNKELEKTLIDMKLMQNSLVQSEKMASLGQLSAGIAHEINNPLAFVSSNFNRLKEYFQDTIELLRKWQSIKTFENHSDELKNKFSEIDEFTELIDLNFILEDFARLTSSIQDGTQRIRKIVEGMRAFSHTSESSFSDADINAAIEDTITIVWNEIKYKATLNKSYGNLPKIKCNIGEIKQLIVNLLVNASHAINEKGIISISTNHEEEFIYIIIEDNGCGISEEIIKKIFDPFFTTKPVGKGTGLGLWISSSIVEKHKGSIKVQSEVGVGTTFTIKLPITQNNFAAINQGTVN